MKKIVLTFTLVFLNLGILQYGKNLQAFAYTARLQAAAESGHVQAQYMMGVCYAEGRGVERSPENALIWYEKAAEQGHPDAEYI